MKRVARFSDCLDHSKSFGDVRTVQLDDSSVAGAIHHLRESPSYELKDPEMKDLSGLLDSLSLNTVFIATLEMENDLNDCWRSERLSTAASL